MCLATTNRNLANRLNPLENIHHMLEWVRKKSLFFCKIFIVLNTQIKIRTQISELPPITFKLLLWAPELRLSGKGLFCNFNAVGKDLLIPFSVSNFLEIIL